MPKKKSLTKLPSGNTRRTVKPTVRSQGDAEIKLPTKKHESPKDITAYNWCIYGEKGIGKSTLAEMFPDVTAHFLTEIGRPDIEGFIIPDRTRNEPDLSWMRIKSYFKLLLEEREPGRIIIDTIDGFAQLCESFHAKNNGVNSLMQTRDHGKTWDLCKTDWNREFAVLLSAGWRFTFLSHAKNRLRNIKGLSREELKELTEVDGEAVSSERQPTARPWSVDWMKIPTSYVGYYGWLGTERILQIRGSGSVFAAAGANSEKHFIQPKGKEYENPGEPYLSIPMGESPQDAYHNLCLGWDNKLEGLFCGLGPSEYVVTTESE